MLHVYVQKFDVTDTAQILLETKRPLNTATVLCTICNPASACRSPNSTNCASSHSLALSAVPQSQKGTIGRMEPCRVVEPVEPLDSRSDGCETSLLFTDSRKTPMPGPANARARAAKIANDFRQDMSSHV